MHLTLEQLRALEALASHGTLQRAAAALGKGHTAVLYALRTLETQTGLRLIDRRAYRLRLSPAGERVLEHARRVLAAEDALERACAGITGGFEPALRLVLDGVLPTAPLLRVVGELVTERAPTRISVSVEYLGGVEEAFEASAADLMVAILPPRIARLSSVGLPPLAAHLVARRDHPLVRGKRTLAAEALCEHVLLSVRGSDPRLGMPTATLEPRATVLLNDFHAKRAALLEGIGFGWLPAHLLEGDARRALRTVRWEGASEHRFSPRVYRRAGGVPGPATRRVIQALTGITAP